MRNSHFSLTPSLSRWERGHAVRVSCIRPVLAAAHAALDRAVDKCYHSADFPSDRARVEYRFQLYERYEQLTAPLVPTAKPQRPRKSRK